MILPGKYTTSERTSIIIRQVNLIDEMVVYGDSWNVTDFNYDLMVSHFYSYNFALEVPLDSPR